MKFLVRCSSRLPRAERDVDLLIEGLPTGPIKMPLSSMNENITEDYIEMPEGYATRREPMQIRLAAYFGQVGGWIRTSAIVSAPAGISIVQVERASLQVEMIHSHLAGDEQCTVRCETTGQSRSGRNVCIECPSGIGVIVICC